MAVLTVLTFVEIWKKILWLIVEVRTRCLPWFCLCCFMYTFIVYFFLCMFVFLFTVTKGEVPGVFTWHHFHRNRTSSGSQSDMWQSDRSRTLGLGYNRGVEGHVEWEMGGFVRTNRHKAATVTGILGETQVLQWLQRNTWNHLCKFL